MGDCFLGDLCECLHLKLNSGKSAQSNLDVGQDEMNVLRLECHYHRRLLDVGQDEMNVLRLECHYHRRLPVWKIQTL